MSVLDTVPSMEPRGAPRPRPGVLRSGEAALIIGFSGIILKILDYAGRWDSAVEIYKALPRFLESGAFLGLSVCMMATGFVILWQFARASEKVSQSQIVHPVTKLPIRPTRYPEYRRYRRALVFALTASVALWVCYQTPLRFLVVKQMPPSFPVGPSVPSKAPALINTQAVPKPEVPMLEHTQPPATNLSGKPTTLDVGAVATNAPATPVVIPVPAQPEPRPPSGKAAPRELTAYAGSKVIRASDKTPGTLYVSVILTEATKYNGTLDDKSVGDVMIALEETGKVSAFTGNDTLVVNPGQKRYAVALGTNAPETIQYFNKDLGTSCNAIKAIVSGIIGMPLTCQFTFVPRRNPGASTAREDFVATSGLDIQVEL